MPKNKKSGGKKKGPNGHNGSNASPAKSKNSSASQHASDETDYFWSSVLDENDFPVPKDLYAHDVVGKTLWQTIAYHKKPDAAIDRIRRRMSRPKNEHARLINSKNSEGYSPLGEAICHGNMPAVLMLISLGGILEDAVPHGLWLHAIIRHLAAIDLSFVEEKLHSSSLLNHPDEQGQTPLGIAITTLQYPELAFALLHAGADPNVSYEHDEHLLHDAMRFGAGLKHAEPTGQPLLANVSDLLEQLLQILDRDYVLASFVDGRNALMEAAIQGKSRWVSIILSYHPACHHVNQDDRNVLHLLADIPDELFTGGHQDTVFLLDEAGIDFLAQDIDGNTPAMRALKQRNSNIANLLLDTRPGHVHLVNRAGEHMLFIAIQSGMRHICETIFELERTDPGKVPLIQINCPVTLHHHILIQKVSGTEVMPDETISPIALAILLWKSQSEPYYFLMMLLRRSHDVDHSKESLYRYAITVNCIHALPLLASFGIPVPANLRSQLLRVGGDAARHISAIDDVNQSLEAHKDAKVLTDIQNIPLAYFPFKWITQRPDLVGDYFVVRCLESHDYHLKTARLWECITFSEKSRLSMFDHRENDFAEELKRIFQAMVLAFEYDKLNKRCRKEHRDNLTTLGITFDKACPEAMGMFTRNPSYTESMSRMIAPYYPDGSDRSGPGDPEAFWRTMLLATPPLSTYGLNKTNQHSVFSVLIDVVDSTILDCLVKKLAQPMYFIYGLHVLHQCQDVTIRQRVLDQFHQLLGNDSLHEKPTIFNALMSKIRGQPLDRPTIICTSAEQPFTPEQLFDIACAYFQHLLNSDGASTDDASVQFHASFQSYLYKQHHILSDDHYVKSWVELGTAHPKLLTNQEYLIQVLLYCAWQTRQHRDVKEYAEIFNIILPHIRQQTIFELRTHPMIISYLTENAQLEKIRVYDSRIYQSLYSYVNYHIITSTLRSSAIHQSLGEQRLAHMKVVRDLQTQVDAQKKRLEKHNDQRGNDQQKVQNQANTIADLKRDLDKQQSETHQLQDQLVSMQASITDLQTNHASEQSEQNDIIKGLQEQIHGLEISIASVEEEKLDLEKNQADYQQLKIRAQQQQSSLDSYKQSSQKDKRQIDSIEQQNSSYIMRIEELEAEQARYTDLNRTLHDQQQQTSSELAELKQQLSESHAKNKGLNEQLQQVTDDHQALHTAWQKVASFVATSPTEQEELSAIETSVDPDPVTADALISAYQATQHQLQQAQRQLKTLQQRLDKKSSALQTLTGQQNSSARVGDFLRDELVQTRRQEKDLQQELDKKSRALQILVGKDGDSATIDQRSRHKPDAYDRQLHAFINGKLAQGRLQEMPPHQSAQQSGQAMAVSGTRSQSARASVTADELVTAFHPAPLDWHGRSPSSPQMRYHKQPSANTDVNKRSNRNKKNQKADSYMNNGLFGDRSSGTSPRHWQAIGQHPPVRGAFESDGQPSFVTSQEAYVAMPGTLFMKSSPQASLTRFSATTRPDCAWLLQSMQHLLNGLDALSDVRGIHLGGSIGLAMARGMTSDQLACLLESYGEDIDLTLQISPDSLLTTDDVSKHLVQTLSGSNATCLSAHKMWLEHQGWYFDILLHKTIPMQWPDAIYWRWNKSQRAWQADLAGLPLIQQYFLRGALESETPAFHNYSFYWAMHQHVKHLATGFSTHVTGTLFLTALETHQNRARIPYIILEILQKFSGTAHWVSAVMLVLHELKGMSADQTTLVHYLLPQGARLAVENTLPVYDMQSATDVPSFLCAIKAHWQCYETNMALLSSTVGPIDWSTIADMPVDQPAMIPR
jgi:ankyrin repeat protein